MSIATRTGDDGTTSLLYGRRVPKDYPAIEAVGALDELNVEIGAVKLTAVGVGDSALGACVRSLQDCLIALMGEVSCDPEDRDRYVKSFQVLVESDLEKLDNAIAEIEATLPPLKGWALPGSNALSLSLDRARVAARRAERRMMSANRNTELRQKWINRLSDYLWLEARRQEANLQ